MWVVLKNVGKIEQFVVESLKRVIEEEFTFPSFHSVVFEGDEGGDYGEDGDAGDDGEDRAR
jgi:hypothetical protein